MIDKMTERSGRPRAPRRPGRPRTRTIERTKRRIEFEQKLAQNEVSVEDHEHGEAKVPTHLLSKGKVISRFVSCGKRGCTCTLGGKLHGPYYYLVINLPDEMRRPGGPRQRWVYLTKEEAERFRRRIRNFHILMNSMLSDLMDELNLA